MQGFFKTVGYILIGIVVIIALVIGTRITQQVMPANSNDSPLAVLFATIIFAGLLLVLLRGIGWMITHPMEVIQRILRIRWW